MNVPYCLRRAKQFHGDRLAIDHEGRQLTYRGGQLATGDRDGIG